MHAPAWNGKICIYNLTPLKAANCDEIITEQAAGAKKDRPELLALMAKLRQGDKLVVWKPDRLARSMRQLVETIEKPETQRVELQSITENINTSSPGGKLVFGIFASLAEFERELIRERAGGEGWYFGAQPPRRSR